MLADYNPNSLTIGYCPKSVGATLNPADDLVDEVKLSSNTDGIYPAIKVARISPNACNLIIRHRSLPFSGSIRLANDIVMFRWCKTYHRLSFNVRNGWKAAARMRPFFQRQILARPLRQSRQ